MQFGLEMSRKLEDWKMQTLMKGLYLGGHGVSAYRFDAPGGSS